MAGVKIGMRVCQFMGEELPESRTWAELKKVAKGTPKPWQFGFGHSEPAPLELVPAQPALQPSTISSEERVKVRRLFRAARSGDQKSLQQILDESVDVNAATRVRGVLLRRIGRHLHLRVFNRPALCRPRHRPALCRPRRSTASHRSAHAALT